MKKCESCGMPMGKPSDFSGSNSASSYCRDCAYDNGTLRPRHEVREKMILSYMKTRKFDRRQAEGFVDEMMARNPAWL